ncbi:bile acid:sodium symporter family protein [Neptunitalea chrysea]|nr:bile acid:sodium symporter family protein [Neptunitalea chrysea]
MRIKRVQVNGFIVSLLTAIIIAYFFPEGSELLHVHEITNIGIGFIFFFYGLKLSFKEVKQGLSNYRLHILVQCSTFILFPLIVLACKPLLESGIGNMLWIGLFFLAVLPSSVSSSVVMVSLARGNVPGAIFNATISGLIGVVVTPVWLGMVVQEVGNVSFLDVFVKLLIQIIIPITLGLFLNKKFGGIAAKRKNWISNFDKTIIVLIVYSSFSNSFISHLFRDMEWTHFVFLYVAVLVLFFGVMFIVYMLAKKVLKFTVEDRITALFCGSKKSLVHGSVMVNVMFGATPQGSLFIIPVMLYHISQILIIAVIAEKMAKRKEIAIG